MIVGHFHLSLLNPNYTPFGVSCRDSVFSLRHHFGPFWEAPTGRVLCRVDVSQNEPPHSKKKMPRRRYPRQKVAHLGWWLISFSPWLKSLEKTHGIQNKQKRCNHCLRDQPHLCPWKRLTCTQIDLNIPLCRKTTI